jgi:hypothetical protein
MESFGLELMHIREGENVIHVRFRDYFDLTFVALAVVGLMKLELRPEGLAVFDTKLADAFVFELAADDAGDILLRLVSLKLVPTAGVTLVADAGGFLTAGPILDPLELLLLAGTRVVALVGGRDDELLIRTKGFFGIDGTDEAEVDGLSGIFFTVFVDMALLSDDRELLKLVRELLLSTSSLLLGNDFGRLSVCCEISGLRKDAVLRGVDETLREAGNAGEQRSDRLRSSDCWFLDSKVCSWFDGRT